MPLLEIPGQRVEIRPIGLSTCPNDEVQRSDPSCHSAPRELAQAPTEPIARHGRLIEARHDNAQAGVANLIWTGSKF